MGSKKRLPRYGGGSASAHGLSRPAQTSLTLRPAQLLNRPRRPLSRGSSPAGYQPNRSSATGANRQLSGWLLPPLVTRALGAHSIKFRSRNRSREEGLDCPFACVDRVGALQNSSAHDVSSGRVGVRWPVFVFAVAEFGQLAKLPILSFLDNFSDRHRPVFCLV